MEAETKLSLKEGGRRTLDRVKTNTALRGKEAES
jgi:hypothetical protein